VVVSDALAAAANALLNAAMNTLSQEGFSIADASSEAGDLVEAMSTCSADPSSVSVFFFSFLGVILF